MRGFLTRDVVITAVLFAGVIALFVLMTASVADKYDRPDMTSESFSRNYNKLTELSAEIETNRQVTSSNSGFSLIGNFDIAFNAVFTVIRLVFNTLGIYGSMFGNFVSDFTFLDSGVILILGTILISLLTVAIVFTWMSSVSRGKL
jgi:hypothetical protein